MIIITYTYFIDSGLRPYKYLLKKEISKKRLTHIETFHTMLLLSYLRVKECIMEHLN